jgi:hypothetical protein
MDETTREPWGPLTESEPKHLIIDKHKKNARITKLKRRRKKDEKMKVLPTSELVRLLRDVADKAPTQKLSHLLEVVAERLIDQEKIAENYRIKAEEVAGK